MSDSTSSFRHTALLYALGFIYGLSLATFLLWTAGFVLMFCATAQLTSPTSDQIDKSTTQNYLARLKRALYWLADFDATPQTLHMASSMIYVYWFTFFAIALMSPYRLADVWEGWVFVEHTIAIGIALLATSVVVVYWLRHLPVGQTWPQACSRCFTRKNPSI